ncbi:exonuclease domain-containing protein [Paraburkholderia oxyphila]|uniref:exonuclease domain-containing protein n=1 Tax=Paraburkholderia oxyphila TaxID=614212 RepID=UPI000486AEEF|nr:exonuclease domain-containing protein [Paraburkholderia oxyphila]
MPQRFVAIDFETANADLASICQVGLVTFEDGKVIDSWGSLVDPQDYFDDINMAIHGIDRATVAGSPTFTELFDEIRSRLEDQIVVSHTSFDRTALLQAAAKHGLAPVSSRWLDSARVVRRAWSQWSRKGYGLTNVCEHLGIAFVAHDAVEDARASGEVLLQAIRATGIGLEQWLERAVKPITPVHCAPSIAMDGNPDGVLAGEEIVFTGALALPRREAAALAATAGCDVAANVRKTTTLLVVGDLDILKLAGHTKSIKQRKAEEWISKGHAIRILKESDFIKMVDLRE